MLIMNWGERKENQKQEKVKKITVMMLFIDGVNQRRRPPVHKRYMRKSERGGGVSPLCVKNRPISVVLLLFNIYIILF